MDTIEEVLANPKVGQLKKGDLEGFRVHKFTMGCQLTLIAYSEYLGVSSVTLRRWVKTGRVLAHKIGRAYTFDVRHLKELKKAHVTKGRAKEL